MIGVISVHDQKYVPLAEWTLHKNKKEYCEKHGYILEYADDGGASLTGKPMAWPPPIPRYPYPDWGGVRYFSLKMCSGDIQKLNGFLVPIVML